VLPIDAAAHSSRWRRRHPVDKAVLGLGLTVLAISLPPWPGAALVLVTALVLLLGPAAVPAGRLWRAYRVPLGFCVTGALPLLMRVGGPGGFLSPAPDGPLRAGELLLRTSAASLGVLLFAFTTPMSDLLPRLVRAGVPAPLVDVALVTYRMSFLLLDSVRRVHRAQAARLGGLGATAFVRSFDRAARLQTGLAGRGYDGALRVLVPEARVSVRFTAASVTLLAALAALTFVLERPLS
jgi:cobalt/nickel transport system permease protein